MFVTFALLAEERLHNIIQKVALDIHRAHNTGLQAGLLSPHISLKQPFRISDLAVIETFFDRFAATITPFDLTLTHISGPAPLEQANARGVVWLEVQETPHRRALHERLNTELASQFTGTDAPFDGSAYHFHATVALVQGAARYHHILNDFSGLRMDITYRPEQIAMFYYDDDTFAPGTYLTYKILPLAQV